MVYIPTNWLNRVTPLSAKNMNKIEQGVYDLSIHTPAKDTKTTLIPATAGWYRIAASAVNVGRNQGVFSIKWTSTNGLYSGRVLFVADVYDSGANNSLTQLGFSYTHLSYILSHARINYHTTPTGNYVYLEINNNQSTVGFDISIDLIDGSGWNLIDAVAGSIPSGYSSTQITFTKGIATSGSIFVGSTALCTNLNANYLGGRSLAQIIGNSSVASSSSSNTWTRIAQTQSGVGRNGGIFHVWYFNANVNGRMTFLANTFNDNSSNNISLKLLDHVCSNPANGITKARFQYHPTNSVAGYLDVFFPNPTNTTLSIYIDIIDPVGWAVSTSANVGISSGYNVKEFNLIEADVIDNAYFSNIQRKIRNGGI